MTKLFCSFESNLIQIEECREFAAFRPSDRAIVSAINGLDALRHPPPTQIGSLWGVFIQ